MGQLTKGLLLVAVVVPMTAYVTATLASPTGPRPTDHSPVILQDAPTTETSTSDDSRGSGDQRKGRGGDPGKAPAGTGGTDTGPDTGTSDSTGSTSGSAGTSPGSSGSGPGRPEPTRNPTPGRPEPTQGRPAEVVTPTPTPVGEDDDDEWDDDGPDDDDDTETEQDDD